MGKTGRSVDSDSDIERLLMGRRVTQEALADIGSDFLLTGLNIALTAPPNDKAFLAL